MSSEISSESDGLGALTSAKSTTGSATDGVAGLASEAASAWRSNSSSKANDAISVASSLATGTEVTASEVRLLDDLISDVSKLKAASVVASLVGVTVTAGSAFNSKSKSKSSAMLLSALGAAVGVVSIGAVAVAAGVDCVSGKLKSKSKSLSLIALLLLLTLLADAVVTGSSIGAKISVGDSRAGAATVAAVAGSLLGGSKSKSSKVNSFDCDCAAVVSVVGSVAVGRGAILVSGTSSAKSKSNSLSALLLIPSTGFAGCAT